MFFDGGTFWALPLTYVHLPKSARVYRVYLFPQSVKIHHSCSGPISGDPVCPQPTSTRSARCPAAPSPNGSFRFLVCPFWVLRVWSSHALWQISRYALAPFAHASLCRACYLMLEAMICVCRCVVFRVAVVCVCVYFMCRSECAVLVVDVLHGFLPQRFTFPVALLMMLPGRMHSVHTIPAARRNLYRCCSSSYTGSWYSLCHMCT